MGRKKKGDDVTLDLDSERKLVQQQLTLEERKRLAELAPDTAAVMLGEPEPRRVHTNITGGTDHMPEPDDPADLVNDRGDGRTPTRKIDVRTEWWLRAESLATANGMSIGDYVEGLIRAAYVAAPLKRKGA